MDVAADAIEPKWLKETPRESEAEFRLLFEKSPDAMLLLDGDVFIDCNQAAAEMMHCASKQQLLALHLYDISPERQPDGRLSTEKAHALIATAFREGSVQFEWLHRRVDGEVELVYFGLAPDFIGQGLGKYFLNRMLLHAWSYVPKRVWLHTCELDHEAALPTYRKAGLAVYHERVIVQKVL